MSEENSKELIRMLIEEKEHQIQTCDKYAGAAAIRVIDSLGDDYKPTPYTEQHRFDVEKWRAKSRILERFIYDLREIERVLQKEKEEEEEK